MAATLKKNVVSKSEVFSAGTHKIYDEWRKVPPGLHTSGQWRGEGLGIRNKERPKAYWDPEDVVFPERLVGLFDKSQTYQLTEPKRSKWLLINKFAHNKEAFGLRPVGDSQPIRRHTTFLQGSVDDLIYRSFDYKHRVTGTPTRFIREGAPIHADAFYVLAPETINYLVLDLDNHFPTLASTEAHMLLVRHLVKHMPDLARLIRASSVFYDYALAGPQGIHIWLTLHSRRGTRELHETVRGFLGEIADPAIDARLRANGLKPTASLEILPAERQLIRMFGSYERRVFTTRELEPKDNGFDAEGLLDHIEWRRTNGDPCDRYHELALAGLGNDIPHAPSTTSVSPAFIALSSTAPSRRSGYMSRIVDACLNGVTEGDVLFQDYLSPLAQALYWREFHDRPDRARLTEEALLRWVDRKHNWMVTRINKGKRRLVDAQIGHVVKGLPATPAGIRSFWGKVVANDQAYPHQKVSFVACMEAVLKNPVTVDKNLLKNLPVLLKGSGGQIAKGNTYNVSKVSSLSSASLLSLPACIETRLRSHLEKAEIRKGKSQQRIVDFALRLLNEIGPRGFRTIDGKRMNTLADLGNGRKHILRYKNLLVGADILEPGWKNTARVKKLAARYHLTPWALDEVRKQ